MVRILDCDCSLGFQDRDSLKTSPPLTPLLHSPVSHNEYTEFIVVASRTELCELHTSRLISNLTVQCVHGWNIITLDVSVV